MAFCSNCGQKLVDGAKFCSGCGVAVRQVAQAVVDTPKVEHQAPNKEEQRKSFFDGEIHKCPSCGEVLNSFTGNCPSCGYELRGAKAVSSVQELANKLQEIESKRGKETWSDILKQKFFQRGRISWVDQEKVTLIKNFPVPNTKEDILEFIAMASAQKRAFKDGRGNEILEIYDAWDMKMEQAFEKAVLLYSDDLSYLERLKLFLDRKHKKIVNKKVARDTRRGLFS
ncbi:MAG: zinc ribbon domain-containing protein [Clostridia bacterium]|nr:zinc ribbon domain-containing protein [Clostridia bacterium]